MLLIQALLRFVGLQRRANGGRTDTDRVSDKVLHPPSLPASAKRGGLASYLSDVFRHPFAGLEIELVTTYRLR